MDSKTITKERYFFNWKELIKSSDVYKLIIEGEEDILGLMAIVDFREEKRIEIKLLASSKENVGRHKKFENIASCLIAFACGLASKKYGEMACVSLLPKTELRGHYINKYKMWEYGKHVSLEGPNLNEMIKKFLI